MVANHFINDFAIFFDKQCWDTHNAKCTSCFWVFVNIYFCKSYFVSHFFI